MVEFNGWGKVIIHFAKVVFFLHNANIIIKSMYSLKWNIFLNKVIAPGFARSNNLQTKYKLNTKFSFHSLNSANAYA